MLQAAPLIEVTAAAAAQDLVDLVTLKSDLGIVDSAQDLRLSRIIAATSLRVAAYIGRPLIEQTYRETRWLDDADQFLDLQRMPITDVSSVVEAGVTLTSGLYAWVDGTGLARIDATGARTTWATGKIVVEYVAGWVAPGTTPSGAQIALPADLYEAALDACRGAYLGKDRDPGTSVKSEAVPDVYQVTYDSAGTGTDENLYGLPFNVARSLDAYRRSSFAY